MKQANKNKSSSQYQKLLPINNKDHANKNENIYKIENNQQKSTLVANIKIQFNTYFNHSQFYRINAKYLHHHKQYTFEADFGHYYKCKFINGLHMKRIKREDFGQVLKIGVPELQFKATQQIVQNQFNNVKNLSLKINNKEYQNINSNYFLDYYSYLNDIRYGCFLFHQPIQMTLDQAIKQNTLSYNEKLNIFQQILKIMEFLNLLNICHRNINPYNLVFVRKLKKNKQKYQQKIDNEYKKNWKFNKQKSEMKICGFYQSTYVYESNKKQYQYPSLEFQNVYTDPNIYNFAKPLFQSDLWSVLIIMYEIIFGKLPHLNNKQQLQKNLAKMTNFQKFFQYYFKGTQIANFSIKNFQLFVKNLKLTSEVFLKILKSKDEQQKNRNEKKSIFRRSSLNQEITDNSTLRQRSKTYFTTQY